VGGFGIVDGAQTAPFGRLRSKSLADEVVTRLNDAILKGQLKPGEKVVEATLSRQMDVSRAPIREAIRMLVERGLLVQVPRRGVFVREYSTREIEEINELRLAIEVGALSNAMSGGFPLQLDALHDTMEAEGRSGLERELEIHRTIVQLYPNEHFLRAYDGVANELRVATPGTKIDKVSEALNSYDYKPLVRVIRTRDRDRAVELLIDCINGFATRLLQAIGPSSPETKVAASSSTSPRGRIAG
jgi:DNA-binding GntR family transcriptional regulator